MAKRSENNITKRNKVVKTKGPRISSSIRAGITFPIGRVHRALKCGNTTKRIAKNASIYLAAVLEYLCNELLELSGVRAMAEKKMRITPRHIAFAIRLDDELNKMLGEVIISGSGYITKNL